jgi:hypothetical protein
MGFTLRIRFQGLCGFVPNTNGKAARVLLLRGGQAHAHGGGLPHTPAADELHIPALLFDLRDLAVSDLRAPEESFFDGRPSGLCRLQGVDLGIDPSRPDALQLSAGKAGQCPNGQIDAFEWLSPVDQLVPNAGGVDDSAFGAAPVHSGVAARMRLTDGTLKVANLTELGGQPVQWDFRPHGHDGANHGGNGHGKKTRTNGNGRPIGASVDLVVQIDAPEVRFTFARLGTTNFGEPLVLAPRAQPNVVDVVVKNVPDPDLRQVLPPERIVLGRVRIRDHHFAHYFQVVKNPPAAGLEPLPHALQFCQAGPRIVEPPAGNNLDCPTSRYSPNTHA